MRKPKRTKVTLLERGTWKTKAPGLLGPNQLHISASIFSCIMILRTFNSAPHPPKKEQNPWQVLRHFPRAPWKSRCCVFITWGRRDPGSCISPPRPWQPAPTADGRGRGDQGATLQAGLKHPNRKENSCSPFTLQF